MQSEDYAEKRKRIDRWFELHGHLECADCNPHPVNKRKPAKKGRVNPASGSKSSAGSASKLSNFTSKAKGTARPGNKPPIGSAAEELAEGSAAKQRKAAGKGSGAKAGQASRRRAVNNQGS